jgi:Zn-dependent peptidase ImmA (M78 family)/DNA-binding XRE family transcriptional regulator
MRTAIPGFTPMRLTQAREARGLSLTVLADLCGISRQSISNYENGKQSPSHSVLERIADKLNLPTQFFLRPYQDRDNSRIFFRALSAATKQARTRAKRRLEWLEETIDYLREFIDFLPVNIPDFDVGKTPHNLHNNDIEKIAKECRREWGLGDGPISNVVRLLENQGTMIALLRLDANNLDSFSIWYLNTPIIVIGNDKCSAVRLRFDSAHELGHLVLHRSIEKIGRYFKEVEVQASRFASAFLLPAEAFTKDFSYPTLNSFLSIKRKWKVSIKAMIKRCYDLNIIDDDDAKRLYMNYNQRRWAKEEPFDNELPVEEPMFNRRCVELIINEKIQSREGILGNLAFTSNDIEELLSLPKGYLTNNSNIEYLPQVRKPMVSKDPSGGTVIPFDKKRE